MEGGYFQNVEGREPQNFSQNSAWMMSSSSIPQFQTHGPSLRPNAFQERGKNVLESSYSRLPYSDNDLQEVRYQPPPQMFSQSQDLFQPPYYSQPRFLSDIEKNVLLEVKKEGESKLVPKKRGRGPAKAKGAKKTKVTAGKAGMKKFEKKIAEAAIPGFEVQEEGEDDKEEGEEEENLRWKDDEVETLIAIRGELEEEFSKVAKKQGQNAWLKVQVRMAAAFRGCTRTALSCKKKYRSLLTEYKNDKRLYDISGNDRHQQNKWFDHMDLWNGTRASVRNQIPASAQESVMESPTPDKASQHQTIEKKSKADRLEGYLEASIQNSKDMIDSFKSTSSLLHMMEGHMAALVQKI